VSIDDSRFGQVVGRHLDGHLVTNENANVPHPHLAAKVGENVHPILKSHPKHHVWEELFDSAF